MGSPRTVVGRTIYEARGPCMKPCSARHMSEPDWGQSKLPGGLPMWYPALSSNSKPHTIRSLTILLTRDAHKHLKIINTSGFTPSLLPVETFSQEPGVNYIHPSLSRTLTSRSSACLGSSTSKKHSYLLSNFPSFSVTPAWATSSCWPSAIPSKLAFLLPSNKQPEIPV